MGTECRNSAIYSDDREQALVVPNVQRLFLRIIPSAKIDDIRSSKAVLDLVRSGNLVPMYEGHHSISYERNRHGAIVYKDDNGRVTNLTQLFKNGELWGIDAEIIDKQLLIARVDKKFGFFPSSIERTFVFTPLTEYLRFTKEALKLSLPIWFIAGVTDVAGYRMLAPDGLTFGGYERTAGSVVENHIIDEGLITGYDMKATDILKPFFNRVWEECGLERPDKELL